MADLTNGSGVYATYNNAGTGVAELGDNYATKTGQGIAGKTTVVTVGMGGGAMTQANLDGIIRGITFGASLQAAAAQSDAFVVVGIGAFTAGSSTSCVLALQGTGTPSTTTGEYFASATLSITATFAGLQ